MWLDLGEGGLGSVDTDVGQDEEVAGAGAGTGLHGKVSFSEGGSVRVRFGSGDTDICQDQDVAGAGAGTGVHGELSSL